MMLFLVLIILIVASASSYNVVVEALCELEVNGARVPNGTERHLGQLSNTEVRFFCGESGRGVFRGSVTPIGFNITYVELDVRRPVTPAILKVKLITVEVIVRNVPSVVTINGSVNGKAMEVDKVEDTIYLRGVVFDTPARVTIRGYTGSTIFEFVAKIGNATTVQIERLYTTPPTIIQPRILTTESRVNITFKPLTLPMEDIPPYSEGYTIEIRPENLRVVKIYLRNAANQSIDGVVKLYISGRESEIIVRDGVAVISAPHEEIRGVAVAHGYKAKSFTIPPNRDEALITLEEITPLDALAEAVTNAVRWITAHPTESVVIATILVATALTLLMLRRKPR